MASIWAFDPKTQLSKLLERVAEGESITITREGKPVAKLVPLRKDKADRRQGSIAEEFRKLRSEIQPGGPSIREMIEEGRKY